MRTHPLVAALGTLCAAYFALWACAPVAMVRPPVPMPADDRSEIGLAAGINEALETTGYLTPMSTPNGPTGQLWYAHHFGDDRFVLGAVVFGGTSSLIGTGVTLRYNAVRAQRFRLGLDVDGGLGWVSAGVPMAFRFTDALWLYTAPSAGYRAAQAIRVPVGLSIGLGDHVLLTPEVSVGAGGAGNGLVYSVAGPQVAASLGSTFRF